MFRKLFKKNTATIGKNSNNNTIIQDSNVYIGNGTSEMISVLGKAGQYGAIQQHYSDYLSAVKQTHPLYPVFSASPSKTLDKLVSTPEMDDAFEKFPKTIKGKFRIDYNKYPHMDKSETPWDYAYRTQTKIELETTAYQEYLGDNPDPFPTTEYEDGMITIIGAPEFPPAMNATIISGEISIPILLRRKPCMEYGQMVFGTEFSKCGFDIDFTSYKDIERTDFRITNIPNCDLETRLNREKLYMEFLKTKSLTIMVGTEHLLTYTFNDSELTNGLFTNSPILVRYIECLLIIEKHTKCKFDISNKDFTEDDYKTALILAASCENKWHRDILDFDDEIRCNYDKIPEGIEKFEQLSVKAHSLEVPLQGKVFLVENFVIVYVGARINNLTSVIKNKERKKDGILLTFRPAEGKDKFFKYYKFENIQLQTERT